MTFKELMATLFSTSQGTYYKWKKEKRPIVSLLDKYFKKEDLEEFLETGEIFKLDLLEHYQYELLEDVDSFFFNLQDLKLDFLLSFLYLSRDKLLDKYNESSYSYFDYYLYDILNEFKEEYKSKIHTIMKIDDFDEQFKELYLSLIKIKYPIYKYLIYNLRYDFKAFISSYSYKSTPYLQDIILMMPFIKNEDFQNINKFRELYIFDKSDIYNIANNKKLILDIVKANNDISKIENIIKNYKNT